VLHERERRTVPGGAANVAANVIALGGRATLVSRRGQDAAGLALEEACDAAGVPFAGVAVRADAPTTCKTRLIAAGQQMARIDREAVIPPDEAEREHVRTELNAWLAVDEPGAVVLADYGKGLLDAALIGEVVAACAARGVPVVADPKSRDLDRYAGVTVLKPNRREAEAAVGAAEPAALADAVLAASGARNVVLSLSADGALVAGADIARPLHLPAHALDVADVSGAGDTLVATLALGLAGGLPLERAAALAALAASRVCEKPGTATLGFSELLHVERLATARATGAKLLDRPTAAAVADALRAEGRRLVFANGCFDVLHAGHTALLQRAREHGDALIVAVNDDAGVRRLKGDGRPAVPLADRLTVLAALESVDYVVAFPEDTPLELILELRPDVIVKGGDYRAEDVVGAAEARAWGGVVEIVPLLAGRSTTALLAGS
jgi:D-beta-D-heptose 7-phosphate kinase/D-beta-D-heptose 1-phosphate adenosyltransferase